MRWPWPNRPPTAGPVRRDARTNPIRLPRVKGAGERSSRDEIPRERTQSRPPRTLASTSCQSSPCVALGAFGVRPPARTNPIGPGVETGACCDGKAGRTGPFPRDRTQSRGMVERPATVGIELYQKTGENTPQQRCARCGEEFAPARFIQDLKRTLYEVGENYTLNRAPKQPFGVSPDEPPVKSTPEIERATSSLWWQDLCPSCKREMRAQANLAALGRDGNQFL